ncbi:MAG: hypothetical protein ABEJ82_01805 [Haloplanus sp.]
MQTINTLRQLLDGALDHADDEKARYRIRTALQYLVVLERERALEHEAVEAAAHEDDELRERLTELGYLS